ncbi:type II toxin-antitoxin system RelB/DinJ family antitoxin [Fusobacterium simiae]|uniref:Type II toxin-antitoxin system RelB/DinJ family antitoxin n=1 Tax=Fusobacterium simiae TaxID=855 RepID=A0ABT4DHE0_FUSSI|nr:type II toxin-antitoxin system RelB/DinJ family antitoxin [Fusobacterium simiae]MCY7008012.1 type II toxin-antitoxin system RelB/DinJ family antitoxin [Fusobacterium simiae]
MSQVSITVKTDEEIKKEFNAFCEEIGLNMSTAINLFMRTVLREQKIPFELKLAKKEFVQNIKNAPTSIEELMENLDV